MRKIQITLDTKIICMIHLYDNARDGDDKGNGAGIPGLALHAGSLIGSIPIFSTENPHGFSDTLCL